VSATLEGIGVELDGKVAIVTGAGGAGIGGLGVVYAKAIAAAGAAVLVSDVDGAAATRIASEIEAEGGHAISVSCDVASDVDIALMVDRATHELGGVDILVNNAGLARGRWNQTSTLSTEDWLRILAVNTVAPVACARACRPVMRARGGGLIVNQSSSGARVNAGAYSVSKLALEKITELLAAEFADDNIRVNAIAPGMMTAELPDDQVAALLAAQTVRRRGRPEDLVGGLLYLCSERSSFMNGQTLVIDGGMTQGGR
jgi:NAD(P)-dependent dehydrogenase (short-subunit alcohol dehydrogenase family)